MIVYVSQYPESRLTLASLHIFWVPPLSHYLHRTSKDARCWACIRARWFELVSKLFRLRLGQPLAFRIVLVPQPPNRRKHLQS